MDTLRSWLDHAYAFVGPLYLAAYLPQLLALWRASDGARGTSLLTWAMWVAALLVTTLYAELVNGDRQFFWTSLCGLVGAVSVLGMATAKRHAARQDAPRGRRLQSSSFAAIPGNSTSVKPKRVKSRTRIG